MAMACWDVGYIEEAIQEIHGFDSKLTSSKESGTTMIHKPGHAGRNISCITHTRIVRLQTFSSSKIVQQVCKLIIVLFVTPIPCIDYYYHWTNHTPTLSFDMSNCISCCATVWFLLCAMLAIDPCLKIQYHLGIFAEAWHPELGPGWLALLCTVWRFSLMVSPQSLKAVVDDTHCMCGSLPLAGRILDMQYRIFQCSIVDDRLTIEAKLVLLSASSMSNHIRDPWVEIIHRRSWNMRIHVPTSADPSSSISQYL